MEDKTMVPASQSIIGSLKMETGEVFTSFSVTTTQDKINLYNAMSGEGQTVKSCINKTIPVVDVIVMPVEVKNEDGSMATVPRVILIDTDGNTYSASSWGVYNSIRRLHSIFGTLHFDEPMMITPTEVKTKGGFTISLNIG